MADEDSNRKSRARQACEPCRRKKTKCSGEYPICTNCSSHGFECSYINVEKRRGPQKGYVRALESRLDSLQNLLEDYVDKISPSAKNTSGSDNLMDGGEVFFDEEDPSNDGNPVESSPYNYSNENQLITSLVSKKHALSQPESSQLLSKKPRSSDDITSASSHSNLSMSYPRKIGHLTMVENGSSKYMGESSGAYLLQDGNSDESQILHKPLTGFPFSSSHPALAPDFIMPKAQTDVLVGLYFSKPHILSPFIVKDDFLAEFEKPVSSLPQPLIDAVCAFSCAFVARSSFSDMIKNPMQLGEALYYRSRQKILSDVDQATSFNIQSLLLLSMCHHLNVGNLGWMSLGIALRMAMEMGLHRDHLPGKMDPSIIKERESRRRLWWGCYIMDRVASVTCGRPLTLDEDEYDTCFPDMEGEANEVSRLSSLHFPKNPLLSDRKKFLYKNIELWRIYGKVTRNIYSVRSRQGYSALKLQSHIQHLFETLQGWYATLLRDWPQLEDSYSTENECYQFSLSLKLNYYSLIILLYRPLLPRPGASISSFAHAFYEKCKLAAIEITNLVSKHPDAFIDLASPFKFYTIVVSFSIHLLGASVSIADAKLRDASKQRVVDCLSVLSYFYKVNPLCGKIIFGSFNVLASLNIFPLGFVDPRWPESLKQMSKIYSDFMAKESQANKPDDQAPSNNKEFNSIPVPRPAQPMNPTQFLQAQVLNDRSHAGASRSRQMSHHNYQIQNENIVQNGNPRPKENNTQAIPKPQPGRASLSSPHDHQMYQNPANTSFIPQRQAQMAAPQESTGEQMASQQQMLNFLQSQNGAPMMPFVSGQMTMPTFPTQMNPYPYPADQMYPAGQSFGQNVENFMWDPLYNFDFSGFNNGL